MLDSCVCGNACGVSRLLNLCCSIDMVTCCKITQGYLPPEVAAKLPSD